MTMISLYPNALEDNLSDDQAKAAGDTMVEEHDGNEIPTEKDQSKILGPNSV